MSEPDPTDAADPSHAASASHAANDSDAANPFHDGNAVDAASPTVGPRAATAELERIADRLRTTPRSTLQVEGFRRAAVLVPVLPRDGRLELLFTVRSAALSRHAGQIAFPGGGLDVGEDAVEAALRETWEEVGVRLGRGSVLGLLDDLPSPAGYVATPVVAVMDPGATLQPNPAEVADVFVAPVADFREITPSWEERRVEGMRRKIHFYPWNGRLIWGFTGNVLKDFLDRAYPPGTDSRDGAGGDAGTPW